MKYNFDEPTVRRGTMSMKWDESADAEMLPLWVADMDFRTAPEVVAAIEARAAQGIYGYTYPGDEYFSAVTDWFAEKHGWKISRESIIYTTGVVPAVSACIKALARPGEGVIVQTPVYNCFFSSIRNNGCRIVSNPLRRTADSYEIDFEDLEKKCADPGNTVLLLCNPHNPSGRVWTREELERIDGICAKNDVTVISDEIHCELVYKPLSYVPFATVATRPAVVCCSPSKAFNTAGLQCANIVAPDEKQRSRIDRAINDNEVCDVGPFGVTGVIAAYRHGSEWLGELLEYLHGNYEYVCGEIERLGRGMKVLRLEGTYLAWVDVRELGMPVEELCERLKTDAKVWFAAGTSYGEDGEGYIRINLATQRNRIAEAMKRFGQFVNGL